MMLVKESLHTLGGPFGAQGTSECSLPLVQGGKVVIVYQNDTPNSWIPTYSVMWACFMSFL